MHEAEAGAQQGIGLAIALGGFQAAPQAIKINPLRRHEVAAVVGAKRGLGQRQIMRQRRIRHRDFVREQDAHRQARRAAHDAGGEVARHGQVVDVQVRMKVAPAHIGARRAAGHEDALVGAGGFTAQFHRLEGVDGHGGNVAPGLHIAHRRAPALAEAAVGGVGAILIRKQPQRELIKLRVGAAVLGNEFKEFRDGRGGVVHGRSLIPVQGSSEARPRKRRKGAAGRMLFLRRHEPGQVRGFDSQHWRAPRSKGNVNPL
ncbi:hypothetical protein D3C71_1332210 [compost metagenome]